MDGEAPARAGSSQVLALKSTPARDPGRASRPGGTIRVGGGRTGRRARTRLPVTGPPEFG